MNELNTFSNFLGLKPNKIKCDIAGNVVLNGVHLEWGSSRNVLILITKP